MAVSDIGGVWPKLGANARLKSEKGFSVQGKAKGVVLPAFYVRRRLSNRFISPHG
jgi:hypothetical protein